MKSPLAIMTVYSVASRLPSLRSALRGLDTTSVHGHLESWATERKPPAGALARKVVKTQTRYSWCLRKRGKSDGRPVGRSAMSQPRAPKRGPRWQGLRKTPPEDGVEMKMVGTQRFELWTP